MWQTPDVINTIRAIEPPFRSAVPDFLRRNSSNTRRRCDGDSGCQPQFGCPRDRTGGLVPLCLLLDVRGDGVYHTTWITMLTRKAISTSEAIHITVRLASARTRGLGPCLGLNLRRRFCGPLPFDDLLPATMGSVLFEIVHSSALIYAVSSCARRLLNWQTKRLPAAASSRHASSETYTCQRFSLKVTLMIEAVRSGMC